MPSACSRSWRTFFSAVLAERHLVRARPVRTGPRPGGAQTDRPRAMPCGPVAAGLSFRLSLDPTTTAPPFGRRPTERFSVSPPGRRWPDTSHGRLSGSARSARPDPDRGTPGRRPPIRSASGSWIDRFSIRGMDLASAIQSREASTSRMTGDRRTTASVPKRANTATGCEARRAISVKPTAATAMTIAHRRRVILGKNRQCTLAKSHATRHNARAACPRCNRAFLAGLCCLRRFFCTIARTCWSERAI